MPEPTCLIREIDPYELALGDPDADPDAARRAKEAQQREDKRLTALSARWQTMPIPRPEPEPEQLPHTDSPQPYARPDTLRPRTPPGPSKPSEESQQGAPSSAWDREWDTAPPAKPTKGNKHAGGRPRRVAPWFQRVAMVMSDGTPLREALARCNIWLTKREIESLYRLKAFKAMYQRLRREYLNHWGDVRGDWRRFFRGPRE